MRTSVEGYPSLLLFVTVTPSEDSGVPYGVKPDLGSAMFVLKETQTILLRKDK